MFADEIRKRRSQQICQVTQWRWHLDEVHVKIRGETHYLRRAVDHEGEVLESNLKKTRDKSAALKFLRGAMRRCGTPETVVTDRLRSYGAAMKEIGNIRREQEGQHHNNRVENNHRHLRRRKRDMSRFSRMTSCTEPRFNKRLARAILASAII